ncbi:MAG: AAA family ATPase [Lachnospiraceae bacterium]|nr:AAA family ATPase [Lachnospiraceae bacterium]
MHEEAYLTLVLDALHEKIAEINGKMEGNQKDIANMHDYFWENYTEFDEYGYELYDNNTALKTRIKEQGEYTKELLRYEKMLDSPYFGRVDFCYEDEDEPETYYIGIANLAKGRAANPYVFDWRAPVSSLFYDYDKGAAQFEAPAGILTGEITRKKQYKIKNGKLVYVLENDINIDDEILQQALSEHADASLKSIVTTIQKEQNSIIRDTKHRILAVQGCAGSGKTSVALHRIAYLLYHNRKNLNAAQVLILSPNSIFADYISRILPELGEENICEMTFDDFAYRELRAYGEAEDRYDEMEKLLHAKETKDYFIENSLIPSTDEAAYKQTKDYMEELNGFILSLEWELVEFRDFHYKKMAITETQIADLFYEKLADVPILSRMEKIGEYLIDAEETLRNKNMEDDEKQEIFDRLNRMYETRNLLDLYNRFLEESGREMLQVTENFLRYEDVYPLLYLKYAILEPPKRREVKHLVIDEMQDYSYLQYVLLEKMFHCPMTILGDKVQTMADTKQDVLSFLPKIFGKEVHCVYLNKSYRSTSEITAFANQLVQETGVETVERHGEVPQTTNCDTLDVMYQKMAADIVQERDADTIAILCLDAKSAQSAAKHLQQELPQQKISLLTKDSMKFQKGISVMPFYLAKGLEFDTVLVPDLQNYTTPLHKQALYINATRALHVLRLYQVTKEENGYDNF